MNILFKRRLPLFVLFFGWFLLPNVGFSMNEEDMDLNKNPSKENIKKEGNKIIHNDFLSRIKNLPKESLEKKKDAKLSPRVRNSEDKFWINEKGEKVLIESK
jgi:hypothetical protein